MENGVKGSTWRTRVRDLVRYEATGWRTYVRKEERIKRVNTCASYIVIPIIYCNSPIFRLEKQNHLKWLSSRSRSRFTSLHKIRRLFAAMEIDRWGKLERSLSPLVNRILSHDRREKRERREVEQRYGDSHETIPFPPATFQGGFFRPEISHDRPLLPQPAKIII